MYERVEVKEYWVNVYLDITESTNQPYAGLMSHKNIKHAKQAASNSKNCPCVYRIHVKMKDRIDYLYDRKVITNNLNTREFWQNN